MKQSDKICQFLKNDNRLRNLQHFPQKNKKEIRRKCAMILIPNGKKAFLMKGGGKSCATFAL